MHLRDHVREDDVDTAISVMLTSFISSQKFSIASTLKKKFNKYLTLEKENDQILLHILQICVKENYNGNIDENNDEEKNEEEKNEEEKDVVIIKFSEFEASKIILLKKGLKIMEFMTHLIL
jgi:DNA replication licensing factor MCM2